MSEGDTGEKSWTESLPEQLQSAPFFKAGEDGAARTVDQVLADINNAAQHMGNSIRVPGPDAGAEDIAAFQTKALEKIPGLMALPNIDDADVMGGIYDKLGRPKTAEEYNAPDIEGMDWGQQNLGKLKGDAHKLGMSQNQFKAMLTDMATGHIEGKSQADVKFNEDTAALRTEWGAAFDSRMATVKDLVSGDGVPADIKQLAESGQLPTATARWLYDIAESIGGEDGQTRNHGKDEPSSITPAEAEAQIDELLNRPEYWDPRSPQQKSLKVRMAELSKLAAV